MAIGNWLARARITDDPAGDLIGDLLKDHNLPRQIPSLEALQAYLQSRNACHEAIKAGSVVWRRYRRWQDRNPVSTHDSANARA